MPGPEKAVAQHYGITDLYGRIMGALKAAGIAESDLKPEHVKPIDEFHIGGVEATKMLLDPLGLSAASQVLDVGSGLGGTARFIVETYGAKVTGIDLTPEFVDCANRLTEALGLQVDFHVGSAFDLPFDEGGFDAACMIHVGMNLPDKSRLFSEVARVLRSGGSFAVYDVMLFGDPPAFPLPWATSPAESFLNAPQEYEAAAEAAGFTLVAQQNRRDVAVAFFARMAERMASGKGPAVDVPMLMGENAAEKRANMSAAVKAGDIAPVEMIFRKG